MIEDGVLVYVSPEKCISRHDEIQNQKTEQQISFDSQGNLKLSRKASDLDCDVTGELRLRQALTRRSLAFVQAGLCSFSKLEEWHTQMMHATMRAPPSGHKYVTMQQVLNADRELWALLSQDTRGSLKVAVGQPPPLDAGLDRLCHSPQILCFMTPLPKGDRHVKEVREESPLKRRKFDKIKKDFNKGSGKGEGSGTGATTVKELLKNLPKNCTSKLDSGKFICLHYNNGTCKKQKSSSCNMGVHVCYYKGCGQKRPYIECKH